MLANDCFLPTLTFFTVLRWWAKAEIFVRANFYRHNATAVESLSLPSLSSSAVGELSWNRIVVSAEVSLKVVCTVRCKIPNNELRGFPFGSSATG